ncbi:hypothetical protein [Streptomyces syringium]|uniref:hypothetical protein n=1 Tax=Streptomyces syringium TaxID=76729 RepID=UPI00340CC1FC
MTTQDKDPLMALLRRAAVGDKVAGAEFGRQRAARMRACARAEGNAHQAALRMIQQRSTS